MSYLWDYAQTELPFSGGPFRRPGIPITFLVGTLELSALGYLLVGGPGTPRQGLGCIGVKQIVMGSRGKRMSKGERCEEGLDF